jgi:hypothetical protein
MGPAACKVAPLGTALVAKDRINPHPLVQSGNHCGEFSNFPIAPPLEPSTERDSHTVGGGE